MKNYVLPILCALALVAGLSAVGPASAQSPIGYQRVVGNSLALTATPAAIVTAVAAKSLAVKALLITSTEASIVQFYSGSGTGSPIGGPGGLAADVPLVIDEKVLGPKGFSTAVGSGLFANAAPNGTVSILVRVQED